LGFLAKKSEGWRDARGTLREASALKTAASSDEEPTRIENQQETAWALNTSQQNKGIFCCRTSTEHLARKLRLPIILWRLLFKIKNATVNN